MNTKWSALLMLLLSPLFIFFFFLMFGWRERCVATDEILIRSSSREGERETEIGVGMNHRHNGRKRYLAFLTPVPWTSYLIRRERA